MQIFHNYIDHSFIETISIVLLYLAVGYLLDPLDILMIHFDFSSLTIVLAIVTLFHGISSGLLAMLLIGITMQYGYSEFHYLYYLNEFILMMIFGEFHYYWNRIINQHATEDKFTRTKLSELSKAFYALKISHDQIEKSYVLKPMSLRNSILKIKENYNQEMNDGFYQDFLQLLQKSLNIDAAFLLSIEDATEGVKMELLAKVSCAENIDKGDLLIEDAYNKMMPLYVSSSESYSGSKYLAAIPAISNGQVIGMLVIVKMPFMSFNKDNLIAATILINYMFDELSKMEILQDIEEFLPHFGSNFRFESFRLHKLNRDFHTETTLLLYKSYDNLSTHLLIEAVTKNLRTLELMSSIKGDRFDIVAVLFPFSDIASVDGFVKRINRVTDIEEGTLYNTSLSIKDIPLIEKYIGDEA